MAHLINKDALVAEIERLRYEKGAFYASDVLYDLEDFINTLDVKDVDLEKSTEEYFQDWQDCCDDGSAVTPDLQSPSLSEIKDIAKYFFELGLKAQKG